jgi:hypothetical protein
VILWHYSVHSPQASLSNLLTDEPSWLIGAQTTSNNLPLPYTPFALEHLLLTPFVAEDWSQPPSSPSDGRQKDTDAFDHLIPDHTSRPGETATSLDRVALHSCLHEAAMEPFTLGLEHILQVIPLCCRNGRKKQNFTRYWVTLSIRTAHGLKWPQEASRDTGNFSFDAMKTLHNLVSSAVARDKRENLGAPGHSLQLDLPRRLHSISSDRVCRKRGTFLRVPDHRYMGRISDRCPTMRLHSSR